MALGYTFQETHAIYSYPGELVKANSENGAMAKLIQQV
jgi:hypothetical protein